MKYSILYFVHVLMQIKNFKQTKLLVTGTVYTHYLHTLLVTGTVYTHYLHTLLITGMVYTPSFCTLLVTEIVYTYSICTLLVTGMVYTHFFCILLVTGTVYLNILLMFPQPPCSVTKWFETMQEHRYVGRGLILMCAAGDKMHAIHFRCVPF